MLYNQKSVIYNISKVYNKQSIQDGKVLKRQKQIDLIGLKNI